MCQNFLRERPTLIDSCTLVQVRRDNGGKYGGQSEDTPDNHELVMLTQDNHVISFARCQKKKIDEKEEKKKEEEKNTNAQKKI